MEGIRRHEILDQQLDPGDAQRALHDLERVNRWLLGLGAAIRTLLPRLRQGTARSRILDVGTGSGQIPEALVSAARRRGIHVEIVGVDRKLAHLMIGRQQRPGQRRVVADADRLPFRSESFDWSMSSLLLHHFDGPTNRRILCEMTRVGCEGAVIVDLRQSLVARLAARILLPLLGTGRIATHDGIVSVDQAWRLADVEQLLTEFEVVELRRRFPLRLSCVVRRRSG